MATRREFLAGAAVAATLPRLITTGIGGPAAAAENPREKDWDQGAVQHLIPTASHDRFLIKASFREPQLAAPELEIGNTRCAASPTPQPAISGSSTSPAFRLRRPTSFR